VVGTQVVEKRNGIAEIDLLVHVCSHNNTKPLNLCCQHSRKSQDTYLVYLLEVLKVASLPIMYPPQNCLHE
jgi:hypothetical protein